MVTSPQIRRRVVVLDTSNQCSLFDFEVESKPPEAEKREVLPKKPLVNFEAPDPREIFINRVRLDEHLRSVGLTASLKLREFLDALSFVEFEAGYRPGGRPPYAPRAMVAIILYGLLQGLSSLRDLERMARLDVSCWWLSGGIMPDHSVLGRFVRQHEALLTEDFFAQLTRQVLKATGSGTGTVAGDGTVIEAMSSRLGLVREEALNQALAAAREDLKEAQAEGAAAQAERRVAQLEQAQQHLNERQAKHAAKGKDPAKTQIQPHEPEAVVQPQKNSKDFRGSYKPMVLANEVRVILACDVHPSSETEPLPDLLDRVSALGPIETALFDSGFFAEGVLRAAAERDIELLCPEGQSEGEDWNKQSAKQFPKSRFEYCADDDVYFCPNQQHLTPRSQYRGNDTTPAYTQYATDACQSCPLKTQCTRSEAGRKIKRYAIDTEKDALRTKMAQPEHRVRYRQRQAMVEPVFSHLRGRQGLKRFRRKGLTGVKVEFALHAMAYNLSRVLALSVIIVLFARLFRPLCVGLRLFRRCCLPTSRRGTRFSSHFYPFDGTLA
jgi:transposase